MKTIDLPALKTQPVRRSEIARDLTGEHDYTLTLFRGKKVTVYDMDLIGVGGEWLTFAIRNQDNGEVYELTVGREKRRGKCSCTGFCCRGECGHEDAVHAHYAAGHIEHPAAAMA